MAVLSAVKPDYPAIGSDLGMRKGGRSMPGLILHCLGMESLSLLIGAVYRSLQRTRTTTHS